MMLQSWMGSDFSNDDLVKDSSLSKDYTATLLSSSSTGYSLELTPHDDAPVVWGKIVMDVSSQFMLPTNVLYYNEEDQLVRKLTYDKVIRFNHRHYPTRWVMTPTDNEKLGNTTVIEIHSAVFAARPYR